MGTLEILFVIIILSLNQSDNPNLAPLIPYLTCMSHQVFLLFVFCLFWGFLVLIIRWFIYILTETCQNSLILLFHLIPLSERNSHCLDSRLLLVSLFLSQLGRAIIFFTLNMLRILTFAAWLKQGKFNSLSASSLSICTTGLVLSDILMKIVEIDLGKRKLFLPEAK